MWAAGRRGVERGGGGRANCGLVSAGRGSPRVYVALWVGAVYLWTCEGVQGWVGVF